MILSEYDFEIEHRRGKNNPADYPSRNLPPQETQEDHDEHELFSITNVLGGMDFAAYLAFKYFLESQTYPLGATEDDRKKLRRRTAAYFLKDGNLFKRRRQAPDGGLEVLHERNAFARITEVHQEFHDGVDNTLHRMLQWYTGPSLRTQPRWSSEHVIPASGITLRM